MFNTRGGFPGQRPMGPPRMNQPGLNHLGMNMSGMNMSGMNMSGMGMSSMNQPNMNLSGMNQPGMNLSGMNKPGMNQPNMNLSGMNQPNMNLSGMNQPSMNTGMTRMSHPGMNTNVGLANVNQPGMNAFRMGPSGINQGGMGFQSEMKGQGYNMKPMDSPGSYHGGSSEQMGLKGMPLRTPERHLGPQALPHFSSSGPMTPAQPRMIMQHQEIPSIVNRVVQHSSEHSRGNPKPSLQEPPHLMEKKPLNPLGMFGNLNPDMGMKPGPSSSLEQMSNTQNRYTNESASSILESFGLSNEDLEELSRYPDDQLTPVNLPNILRDIRLRKINRSGGAHDQGGGGRRPGGEVLPSKVIDYGHSSKFQYNDNPAPSRPFESSRANQKPSPASKEPAGINKSGKGKNAMENKMVTVLKSENPVITIKPDSSAFCDIPVVSDAAVNTPPPNMTAESPIGTVVSQVSYPPPAETTTPTGKGNWVPPLSQDETRKMKRMPTPSMMNDYFAASPRIFPHICSLCNVECKHLKVWIKHQNTTTHIESCRKLRQQYPDWNPQVHTLRNESKKDEAPPKRSRTKSGSPRRSRRSGSRSRTRRSCSRSPRSTRRSRSRSPRRGRHSPRRSRSPRKSTRSPRRSPSPRRHRRGRSSTPPDKRAVDAAVQNFIAASKIKSGEKPKSTRSPSDVKKLPPKSTNSNVKDKKPGEGSTPPKNGSSTAKKTSSSSYSSSSKKPGGSSSVKPGGSSSSSVKPGGSSSSVKSCGSSSSGSASHNTKKPLPSTSKKPVVSTAAKKTTSSTASSKKPPSKSSNAQKNPNDPASEAYNALDKIIHITNLPDSGYTDQDLLKIVQPFGKARDIVIVRSKNEAFLETNFKEAAAAAVKFSETVPIMINGNRVVLSMAGSRKEQAKKAAKATSNTESGKSSLQKAAPTKDHKDVKTSKEEKTSKDVKTSKEEKEKKTPEEQKHDIEVPPGFVKCHRLADPPLKEAEKCVVVISNLPEKQYTVEEISNLARPFGGVSDVLVISNYRKAYLELPSRNSVDSMLKFYSVFPTCLSGNTLTIAMAPAYKDLKDENRIFAEIIEQASFKITPTIYKKFVHLSNLPEKEINEFELTRIGLRFGKVEHYIVISNKRKAILHMNSSGAANVMHNFLSRFPGRIGESILKCTLVAEPMLSEDEYITYLEEKKSSDPDDIYEDVAPNPDEVSQLEEEEASSASNVAKKDVKASGTYSNVEVEDDDDDEEAAEAAEAPEAPSCFTQPEPVEEKPAYSAVPQPYVAEESDVLVSVESDEECDSLCADDQNAIPVMDCVSMEHLLTAEDSDESDSNVMETSDNVMEESADVLETPDDVLEASDNVLEASDNVLEASDNVLEASDNILGVPADVLELPADVLEVPADVLEVPADVLEVPADVLEVPADVLELPADVLGVPTDVLEVPADVLEVPAHVLEAPSHVLKVPDDFLEVPDDFLEVPADVMEAANVLETSANEVLVECPKPVDNALAVDDQNSIAVEQRPEDAKTEELTAGASQTPDTTAEPPNQEPESSSVFVKEETSPPKVEESSDKETKSESSPAPGNEKSKPSEETAHSTNDKSRQARGRSRQSSHGRNAEEVAAVEANAESKAAEQAASKASITRTAKYNPKRGELSVTLTVDGQKSSSRTPDSKKRLSGDRASSGRESSTPKSSSNRSSPSESASSNPKSSTGSYQTKSGHRGVSSQDRDSKVTTRSRDSDFRSSRKDDSSKDSNSSSSRYTRSSTRSTRGQRSKEEGVDCFPFNLDEFVTVDEIVEDQTELKEEEKDEEKKSQATSASKRGGKRKESYSPASDSKKPKEAIGDPQELSFVTLDEVSDEEENTTAPESTKDEAPPSQTKADEVPAEDQVPAVESPPPSAQEPNVLMTLDEVSDDDEPNASVLPSGSSTIPDKDQLLTLDEISGEDEEQTSHSEPFDPDKWFTHVKESKEGDSSENPETKEKPEAPDVPPQEPDQESQTEQPLLTLDEVKADDDDDLDCLADMDQHFLTVDEVGEEEDDLEVKEEVVEKVVEKVQPKSPSKPVQTNSETSSKSSKPGPKTPARRRGRPRKRPLSGNADDDDDDDDNDKDAAQPTSADSSMVRETVKTPTKPKAKATKVADQPGTDDSTMATPDKPPTVPGSGSSTPKTETPAKKTKLEPPRSEKTKLGPFNSSVPVGLEFLVPKTGFFCELCSLFYMDDASKVKHCKSLRHYQAVQKHLAKEEEAAVERSSST